jgi:para-nitrobenzyl esterase
MSFAVVATGLGKLQGQRIGDVHQFRNVPFALPPLGALRFAVPQPPQPWAGIREATEHGAIPPQRPSRLRNVVGDFTRPQSEDCLSLTISTPAFRENELCPVVVFFHGGAYQAHAGSLDWYDGSALASRGGLVVVSANYRLGALGFLAKEGSGEGRQGLLDMVAALHWVANHIKSFGGDPRRVTVMGQSAGGHAITCMLAMPEARGLFRRAIIQSGVGGVPTFSNAHALHVHREFTKALRVSASEALPDELLAASEAVERSNHTFGDVRPLFMPTINRLSNGAEFLAAAADGVIERKIEVLIGTTREEAHAFFCAPGALKPPPQAVASAIERLMPEEEVIDAIRARRPDAAGLQLLSDVVTDRLFRRPTIDFAQAIAAQGGRAWTYQLDWAPDGSALGACHCLELPLVFGNLDAWQSAPMLAGANRAALAKLSRSVQARWIEFIRNGDLKPGFIAWPGLDHRRSAIRFKAYKSRSGSNPLKFENTRIVR